MFLPMLLAQLHEPVMQATMFTVIMSGLESLTGGTLLLASAIILDRQLTAARTVAPVAGYPNLPPTYPSIPPTQS